MSVLFFQLRSARTPSCCRPHLTADKHLSCFSSSSEDYAPVTMNALGFVWACVLVPLGHLPGNDWDS